MLHLVEPLGFAIDDKRMKRAGLDYWHLLDVRMYKNLDEFLRKIRMAATSMRQQRRHTPIMRAEYRDGDYLMFGKRDPRSAGSAAHRAPGTLCSHSHERARAALICLTRSLLSCLRHCGRPALKI